MRFHRSATALVFLSIALPATAALDMVGNIDSSGGSSSYRGKGNMFSVASSVTLTQQDFYINFTGERTLNFSVYRSDTGDKEGAYTQIQSNAVTVNGIGESWYSSGPINVLLQAGKHYVTAYTLPGSFTYYMMPGATSQTVSFGQQVSGVNFFADPPPLSFSFSGDNTVIYHQRLWTTAAPEPASLGLLGLGAVAVLRRRSQR